MNRGLKEEEECLIEIKLSKLLEESNGNWIKFLFIAGGLDELVELTGLELLLLRSFFVRGEISDSAVEIEFKGGLMEFSLLSAVLLSSFLISSCLLSLL